MENLEKSENFVAQTFWEKTWNLTKTGKLWEFLNSAPRNLSDLWPKKK